MYAAALLAPGVPVALFPKPTKVFITLSNLSVGVFPDSPAAGKANRNIKNRSPKRRYAPHCRLYTKLLPLRLRGGTDLFGFRMLNIRKVDISNLIRQMLYWLNRLCWFNWLNWFYSSGLLINSFRLIKRCIKQP